MSGQGPQQGSCGVELMVADEQQREPVTGKLEGLGAAFQSEMDAALKMDARVAVVFQREFRQAHDGPCGAVAGILFHPYFQGGDGFG